MAKLLFHLSIGSAVVFVIGICGMLGNDVTGMVLLVPFIAIVSWMVAESI